MNCPDCNHRHDEHDADYGCGREHRDPALGAFPFVCSCPASPAEIERRLGA